MARIQISRKHKGLIQRLVLALACTLLIVYFYPHPEASHYSYEEGRPWNYPTLFAPFDIPIHPDSATIRAARDSLDARFVPVYELNQLVIDTIIQSLPVAPGTNHASLLAHRLRRIYAGGVIDIDTQDKIDNGTLPKVRILDGNILSENSTADFTSPRKIYEYLDSTITDPALHRYFSQARLPELLRPNVVYNDSESKRHYNYDYLTLTADRGVIQQGQTIVVKGNIISPQDYTNLRTYETMYEAERTKDSKNDFLMLLGQFVFVGMLLASLLLYIYHNTPDVYANLRAIVFLMSLILLFYLIAVGMSTFAGSGIYVVPITIVPVLVLVFFDRRTALYTHMVLTLICAGLSSYALEFIFLQFCAGAAAVYSLSELSRRSQLLRTSMVVAATYTVGYLALELLMSGTFEGINWHMPIYLVINAALTSMGYILMFAVERIFGFVSVVTLIELTDTNTPLLRELSDSCPGTFQHSMAVGNLASDAARAIGCDEPLVRAGALYHDIGKLSNPAFFTENQHGVNPHDTLHPEQSAAIVISHVNDGLRRADKAKLPSVIKDFIREHHGAGKAKYFYLTYLREHEGEAIDESLFTYPGPNPRSRETSVLMMADAVEAASRSLTGHTREDLTALVDRIIDGQIAERLHAGSTLTFRDVPVIKEAFVKRLMTMYHSRIAYPKD